MRELGRFRVDEGKRFPWWKFRGRSETDFRAEYRRGNRERGIRMMLRNKTVRRAGILKGKRREERERQKERESIRYDVEDSGAITDPLQWAKDSRVPLVCNSIVITLSHDCGRFDRIRHRLKINEPREKRLYGQLRHRRMIPPGNVMISLIEFFLITIMLALEKNYMVYAATMRR